MIYHEDREIASPEGLTFCMPIPTLDWRKLCIAAKQFKGHLPSGHFYAYRLGKGRKRFVIIAMDNALNPAERDIVLTDAAWLRMVKNYTGSIICVPHTRSIESIQSLYRTPIADIPEGYAHLKFEHEGD